MEKLFLSIYVSISLIVGIVDLIIAKKSYQREGQMAYYLGKTAFFSFLVDMTYLISMLAKRKVFFSIMSSCYFISIDYMLIALLNFLIAFTRNDKEGKFDPMIKVFRFYAFLEVIFFTLNVFFETSVEYELSGFLYFSRYIYNMKFLFYCHLAFTYCMVVIAGVFLIHKCITVPRQYRNQYTSILTSILIIVLINAIFLYTKTYGINIYNVIDYSILGYSFALYTLFWSCFQYSEHDMLKGLSKTIFDNLDQGIVLFDYDGFFVMNNTTAFKELQNIPVQFAKSLTMSDFMKKLNLLQDTDFSKDFYTVQFYLKEEGSSIPYRCDYLKLRNKKSKELLGNLFVFTNMRMEIDLLTGFHNLDHLRRYTIEDSKEFEKFSMAVVCDINGLSMINDNQGHEYGNQKIKELSELMKTYFPENTYFVRGRDAHMIAILKQSDKCIVKKAMEEIERRFDCKIQYAVSLCKEGEDIKDCIAEATRAMMTKKLLDQESIRSQILNTLVEAMQQTDKDTEAHVKRTQKLGSMLGHRIGLSDMEQGNLSLLCLMHDIGKIGIPLEILNKPGKLSKEEWNVMKSHVIKGYQIAISSPECRDIADMILHHHERWDGMGYPDGIQGEEIPLLSRMISVVDSYDAMVNDRPYRKGISSFEAIKELRRCAGTQFDPKIVDEFVGLLKENPDLQSRRIDSEMEKNQSLQNNNGDVRVSKNIRKIYHTRYIIDNVGEILEADDFFEEVTGYTQNDITESLINHFSLIPPSDLMEYGDLVEDTLNKGMVVYLQHRFQKKDKTIILVNCFGRRYYDSAANKERNEIIVTPISL